MDIISMVLGSNGGSADLTEVNSKIQSNANEINTLKNYPRKPIYSLSKLGINATKEKPTTTLEIFNKLPNGSIGIFMSDDNKLISDYPQSLGAYGVLIICKENNNAYHILFRKSFYGGGEARDNRIATGWITNDKTAVKWREIVFKDELSSYATTDKVTKLEQTVNSQATMIAELKQQVEARLKEKVANVTTTTSET